MDITNDKMKYFKELDYNCVLKNIETMNNPIQIEGVQNLIIFFGWKWNADTNELETILKNKINDMVI
jgi:hypothetical protein